MILICLSKRAPSEQVAIDSYKVYCDLKKAPHLDVEYAHHASGAPYFKGDETTFISLSHSGEWVVCALSQTPIGIDIQQNKQIDYQKISKRFGIVAENLQDFYQKFTLSEAYAKQQGCGLAQSLKLSPQIIGTTYTFIKGYTLSIVGASEVMVVVL